jgi:predicted AlkP superfamily pyrophosphatase or phosphodiesterase
MFKLVRISVLTLVFLQAIACVPALATDHQGGRNFPAGTGGINAPYQLDKPYVIMISIDGFRWDYMDLHHAPSLKRLAKEGVRAERLLPVFPTLTFPNHYSLATGLYPARHGLMANEFPVDGDDDWYRLSLRETVENGRYYRGEPIWVTAETQGMVTASFFWVGSEADIQGVRPTHWRRFNKDVKGSDRIDQVLEWLAEPVASRPHFYTLYFEELDDYTHWYGPSSSEGGKAVMRIDAHIERLLKGLENLPHGKQVNIVLVSDHGQAEYLENEKPLVLDQLVKLDDISSVDGGCYVFMHFDEPDHNRAIEIRDAINRNWNHGRAYLPGDTPAQWYVTDDARFPEVIVVAEAGHGVISTASMAYKVGSGDHGWAPEAEQMHGIFLAWGPDIRQGMEIGPIRTVDVYPLLLSLLDLSPPELMDGDPEALQGILK